MSVQRLGTTTGRAAAVFAIAAAAVVAVLSGPSDGHAGLSVAAAAPTTSTSGKPSFRSDADGYLDTEAHCVAGQSGVAYGRTARSLVVICADRAGALEYRGLRISDGALLTAPAEAGDAGSYQAVNDGVVYTVSPTELRVTAEDKVVYRDTWIEYITPRFAAEAGAPSSSKTAASPTPSSGVAKPR
ncbi:hypothetical protein MINS_27840 [Mycolicibacterium insubricum]|jgi:hypothetical protein|uniref:hypothetical protein n=1 Tax=Mycolicibacterium insubricum TaxID=444597 RepID=UPI0010564E00|nr:hypothetical protein [Mycolicibacterium insubricum]MCB9441747.1 hypothetical protein [Mycolicibacterium sp.]BBZ67355.1 hypothetical protein MINS_27840 [Mycolicibacterium insubricum]